MKIHNGTYTGDLIVKSRGMEFMLSGYLVSDDIKYLTVLAIDHDADFVLYYDSRNRTYRAGCRVFSYTEAINHWTGIVAGNDPDIHYSERKARARKFLRAIEKHHAEIVHQKKLAKARRLRLQATKKTVTVRSRGRRRAA